MVRNEVVHKLMAAANDGMTQVAEGTTADEVFSAYLTLTRNAMRVAKSLGASNESVKAAIGQLWLECDAETQA